MLMRFTGQGVGHRNIWERMKAFRDDLAAAYGEWVPEETEEVEEDEDLDVEQDENENLMDELSDEEVEEAENEEDDFILSDEEEAAEEDDQIEENKDILGEMDALGYAEL